MANVCENRMYVQSEDEQNLIAIREYFDNWKSACIDEIDSDSFEVYFDSRWDFPLADMQDMVKLIPNKDDIYIKCLSIEWGESYCEFNEYDGDGDWYNP